MIMRRVGVSVAIVLSVAAGLALAAEQTTLPGTSYSIVLPGSPECETEAVKLPFNMDFPARCSVEVAGLKYAFDYKVLPYEVPSDEAEGAMFAMALGHATAMDGSIVDKKLGKIAGFTSMDFTITTDNRGSIGYGRYVIVETHLVRAVVESTGESMTREAADKVLKSLTVE